MTTIVQQSWQFAGLVGLGFLTAAVVLRFAFEDDRDGWHLILAAIGSSIVLLSNQGLVSDSPTQSFLTLIGAGTMLLLLGGVSTYLFMTLHHDPDDVF